MDRRMVYRRQRSDGLGFRDRQPRTRAEKIFLHAARQIRSGQFDAAASRVDQSAAGFGDRLFLQRRSHIGRLPQFVRQTELSTL